MTRRGESETVSETKGGLEIKWRNHRCIPYYAIDFEAGHTAEYDGQNLTIPAFGAVAFSGQARRSLARAAA
jgi:hypothetical protein